MEKKLAKDRELHVTFIDLQKAFYSVLLQNYGLLWVNNSTVQRKPNYHQDWKHIVLAVLLSLSNSV
ncbi:hypothetical protein J437_LFUL017479 [Ladona fulva]|uniref:Uncharacterized protein n=1 Tax=Ladona fulva TaxID=123851 RepID=A0A8K0KPK6_LADFU|nr:hypothetical protein J437_LFUL017479 [Ladona fulva]